MAGGDCLHENISACGCFYGAGDCVSVDGVGGELTEQFILDAAADDVKDLNRILSDGFDMIKDPALIQREAFHDYPDELSFSF